MSKISIDLSSMISEKNNLAVFSGCMETLRRLGKASSMIEAFKVTVARLTPVPMYGPKIRVHLSDPFGRKTFFETDFRFMGKGDGNPSSEDVVNCLMKDLPKIMKELIERSRNNMSMTAEIFEELFGEVIELQKTKLPS